MVSGEHRLAFLEVAHRLPGDLQRRGNRRKRNRAPRAADDRNLPELLRPGRPDRPQHRVQRLRLALPRRQRRDLRRRLAVVPALLVHMGFHLFPAGREGLLDPPVIARDLEAPHPPRHRRQDRVALRDQAPRQLVPVIGPDQYGVPVQLGRLDALPPALAVAGHVGDHRMGVQLRVKVPARDMPEQRRRHAVPLHARTPPGSGVVAPRLQLRLLDPLQRRLHRLVMAAQHAPVAARMFPRRQQCRKRDGFRGGEGDVETGAMLVLAVALAPQPDVRPQHMPLKKRLERGRRDLLSLLQPERRQTLPIPGARQSVLRRLRPRGLTVAAGRRIVAALLMEILRRRG